MINEILLVLKPEIAGFLLMIAFIKAMVLMRSLIQRNWPEAQHQHSQAPLLF
jgi:hypothetical protein